MWVMWCGTDIEGLGRTTALLIGPVERMSPTGVMLDDHGFGMLVLVPGWR